MDRNCEVICPKCGKEFRALQIGSIVAVFCCGLVVEDREYEETYKKMMEAGNDH